MPVETPAKPNCWEFLECGREPGGDKADELGVCPAAVEAKLDGVHGGRNAGRSCWVVVATLCNDEMQGTLATKYRNCMACPFYLSVERDEERKLQEPGALISLLRGDSVPETHRAPKGS